MKIKVQKKSFDEVMALEQPSHQRPARQSALMRLLLLALSRGDMAATDAAFTEKDMEGLENTPCLILMNHSSFIDLKLAATYLWRRPYSIVCTSDGFVGKYGLMRSLGCIPTQKFVTSPTLVRDIDYTLRTLKQSVLMYPEASYSFDGTATPLPEGTGRLIKLLGVPVVTIITHGAFARDPLYNGLQLRDVKVSAEVSRLLTSEQIAESSPEQINALLRQRFSFDNFAWQRDEGVLIDEPFRADGLNRVLYKCPDCGSEGGMVGSGVYLDCLSCKQRWLLTEQGQLEARRGPTAFPHIPDWYAWERAEVGRELAEGSYGLDIAVDIRMMVDYKAIYEVGEGRLTHGPDGFHLTGCDGRLDYRQRPAASYGLYADYLWYELGDMISIGDKRALYYCFPKDGRDVVAKTRLATEELFKLQRAGRRGQSKA